MVSSTPQTARTQIKALANINKKLKKSIETKVFDNMEDMAKALMSEEIDIIVYDSSYQSTMEKAVEDFKSGTKVIYECEIEETQDLSLDVPVQTEPFTVYISGIDIYGNVEDMSPKRREISLPRLIRRHTRSYL